MYTPRKHETTTKPQPDAWLLEDIQIRKLVHLNQPPGHGHIHTKPPTRTATVTTALPHRTKTHGLNTRPYLDSNTNTVNTDIDALETKLRALQAVCKQERAEKGFRVARGMKRNAKNSGPKFRDLDRGEWKLEEDDRGRGRGYYPTMMDIEKEKTAREMVERERTAALRRAVEDELSQVRKERGLREQRERERELRVVEEEEEEARVERERVLRREVEEKMRREREREVLKKVREFELEEEAVARAVEDSIVTEAARKLADKQREKNRVEDMVEKMRLEAEGRAHEERLRRRVEGKRGGYDTNTSGFDGPAGPFSPGLPRLVGNVRAFVEDDWQRRPYSPKLDAYSPTSTDGQTDFPYPPHEAARYGYAQPTTPSFEAKGQDLRWGGRDLGIDETDTQGWCKTGKDGRRWRETTTERWETVIHRDGTGHDGYRRYKEVSKFTRHTV
ncbi:hypothetical protein N658DRAFT_510504 [Parathielavia hyrcaniae]|uniref:Uncharacterized protein n=1 Tax=Parathielavia hyrcaniae TaxID=113614 RepID=A0AAN6SY88_9PEZI|nr:hypothetical protein N658DRAFT_510504 [Parathielavia hyrcaniae]